MEELPEARTSLSKRRDQITPMDRNWGSWVKGDVQAFVSAGFVSHQNMASSFVSHMSTQMLLTA